MADPLQMTVRMSDLDNLLDAAKECSEDLRHELNQRYVGRAKSPTEMRRWKRDVACVDRLEACIATMRINEGYP